MSLRGALSNAYRSLNEREETRLEQLRQDVDTLGTAAPQSLRDELAELEEQVDA